jgi:N-ethylmaleimide reductase
MLFEPYANECLSLGNRVAMAPMTRCRADHRDAVPNDLIVEYYRQRATAGLIISEGIPVSDNARGYLNTPALWNESQAMGWSRVTDAVHRESGKIFGQLWHCGRIGVAAVHADRSAPVGPSAIRAPGVELKIPTPDGLQLVPCDVPHELSVSEIAQIVSDYRASAQLARSAGFDGVEIHGGNGYLFDQFRCPFANQRTDRYGGSLENRFRILLEVIDAVCTVWHPHRVSVRQAPRGRNNGMEVDPEPMTTYPWIARELDRRNIGFLHVYDQSATWIHERDPLFHAIRESFSNAVIVCGGFDQVRAEAALENGADLVAFGKPFISNPDFVERMRLGATLNQWDANTFYGPPTEAGYTDYPRLASSWPDVLQPREHVPIISNP